MKHQFKYGILSAILLLSMLFFAGCGTQDVEQNKQTDTNAVEENIADEEEGSKEGDSELFPVTITDDADREVTIEKAPESIVSIQASFTEILFALGTGDKIVGVSDYDNYPPEALEIEKVGGQDMNAELILKLLPDVAFVTDYHYDNHKNILEQYEETGIDVIVVGSADSFEDTYNKMRMIAEATGTQDKAEEIITDMQERLQVIKEKAEETITDKKKVWVEVSPAPDIFTTGKNTFMHEMLESIQAINVAEEEDGWVQFTEEEIVNLNPEVIITTYGYYIDNPENEVYSRDGWGEVPAVKNEQVFDVNNDTVTRPGPRLIEGVETLAKLIYPEVFDE